MGLLSLTQRANEKFNTLAGFGKYQGRNGCSTFGSGPRGQRQELRSLHTFMWGSSL
jgi:hypothetical protein